MPSVHQVDFCREGRDLVPVMSAERTYRAILGNRSSNFWLHSVSSVEDGIASIALRELKHAE